MAHLGFDSTTVAPSEEFSVIPAGEYVAMITASEVKNTKAGNGSYLNLRFDIVDGQYKGRVLFSALNIWNQNPKAVEIAQRDLSAICHATGILQVQDSSQLHNRPMIIKVGISAPSNGYEASNEIRAYKPLNATPAAPAQSAPVQQAPVNEAPVQAVVQESPMGHQPVETPAPATGGTAVPPWKK